MQSCLPPGFRFHPTDEELILHYLRNRVASTPLPVSIIAEVDVYKFNPWDLPAIAAFGEKEWYFFTPRERKYPNGVRPNRAAASGYWKATGTDKTIVNVGVLVFYKGRPPKGTKTDWIMHEYRLADALLPLPNDNTNNSTQNIIKDSSSMRLDDWVLCRIYKKSHTLATCSTSAAATASEEGQEEEKLFQESLAASHNNNMMNGLFPQKSTSFSNLLDAMDYSLLNSFLSDTTNPPTLGSSHPFFDINHGTNNDCYLLDKIPDLTYSTPTFQDRLKRHNSTVDHH